MTMSSRRIIYRKPHPSSSALWDCWTDEDLGRACERLGITCRERKFHMTLQVGRLLRRLGLVRNVRSLSHFAEFVTLPYLSEYKLFPATYYSEVIPFIYDCWPPRYREWIGLCRRHDIQIAFVTARQSRDYLAARLPHIEFIWMPEACNPDTFIAAKPLSERTIDVLEYGRKLEPLHSQIAEGLHAAGITLAVSSGDLTREDFVQRLASAKTVICFPRCMTHPDSTGDVETVTQRYFECMASRCLIVGHCPTELRDVYGYNPVIELDLLRPTRHLCEILDTIHDYQPLVDRNYEMTRKVGTWDRRIRDMISILRERGYDAG